MNFLIRWRARKLACRGDWLVSQTRHLLDTRGVEITPHDQTYIEGLLER
jgi:hypothetical protein